MAPPPKAQLTPDEFLLRNLVARKSIITYRSLSRDLEIHVNDAKTALAEFHTKHQDEKIFATYMVCGFTKQGEETMDVDDEDSEPVRNLEAILTAEKDLDQTKARLEKVTSVWMYCLSPSQLRDPGVMSETVDHVRQIDGSKDFEFAQSLGVLKSRDMKLDKNSRTKSKAPPLKATVVPPMNTPSDLPTTNASSSKAAKAVAKPQPAKPQQVKPKASGNMNDFFGKRTASATKVVAKPKPAPSKPTKVEPEPPLQSGSVEPTKKKVDTNTKQRGMKRKSTAPESDIESEPAVSKAASKVASGRVIKGVVMSDDEDEEMMPVVPKQKGKAKAAVAPDSDEEMGKALFDMDVDEPISRPRSAASDAAVVDGGDGPQTSEPEDGDIEMEDDSDPAPVKKARKPKKVVPVGRNGLKKRRVIKKRKTVNEKGYTQTEDYSEYESVDEEETQEVTAPKKSKSTPAAGPSTSPSKSEESKKSKQETKKAEPKKTSKAPAKKPIGKQKDLSSFFGKK